MILELTTWSINSSSGPSMLGFWLGELSDTIISATTRLTVYLQKCLRHSCFVFRKHLWTRKGDGRILISAMLVWSRRRIDLPGHIRGRRQWSVWDFRLLMVSDVHLRSLCEFIARDVCNSSSAFIVGSPYVADQFLSGSISVRWPEVKCWMKMAHLLKLPLSTCRCTLEARGVKLQMK